MHYIPDRDQVLKSGPFRSHCILTFVFPFKIQVPLVWAEMDNIFYERHSLVFFPPLSSCKCLLKLLESEDAKLQINTGYISFDFHHYAFSNEPSKRLHKRMHNHIGCICLTFLQCAFLNESSNCLSDKMQSHIGCICLTFLQCAFF